jgi:uncharacterized membrane protein
MGTAVYCFIHSFIARFFFERDLLVARICMVFTGVLVLMGVVYYLFDRSSKFKVKDKSQLIQYFLILPFILLPISSTFLDEILRREGSPRIFVYIYDTYGVISIFTALAGIIMFIVNIVRAFKPKGTNNNSIK